LIVVLYSFSLFLLSSVNVDVINLIMCREVWVMKHIYRKLSLYCLVTALHLNYSALLWYQAFILMFQCDRIIMQYCLSLCLSVSQTHTHTHFVTFCLARAHTHTHTHTYPLTALVLSIILSHTYTHFLSLSLQ
jgi:hypothetical protein